MDHRYVDPVRKAITSRLPATFLRIASIPPAAALWAVIKLSTVRDLMEKVPRNFLTAIILPRCITTRSTKFTPTFSTNW